MSVCECVCVCVCQASPTNTPASFPTLLMTLSTHYSSRCDCTSQLVAETIRRTCVKYFLQEHAFRTPYTMLYAFPPRLKEN